MIRILLNSGKPCQRQVPSPAIFGHANEVPLFVPTVLFVFCTNAETPTEATSGFMRPSALGPKLENAPTAPLDETAPTATTLSPSEGAIRKCQALLPSLPAALKTMIPFFAARSAPVVHIVV